MSDVWKKKIFAAYTMRKVYYYSDLPSTALDLSQVNIVPDLLHVFNSDKGIAGSILGFAEKPNKSTPQKIIYFGVDYDEISSLVDRV